MAARERLPAICEARNFVDDGGLVSYGPDLRDAYRRAGAFVDRISKGTRPGNLPVEQPDRLALVFNLKAAKALELPVPPSLLSRADEVIQ
jgi:putative ABC transport system substrate-binding protein